MAETIRLVTLENLEPRLACYNLDHNHAVARVFPQVVELANGAQHGQFVERLLPDSVTFLAKEIRNLPASILGCSEISEAISPTSPGAQPRLRQRGDVVEDSEPEARADAAPEAVNLTAKKARDAARQVTKATVEGQV